MGTIQMTLDLAEVTGARDDFLAGITPLVEAYTTNPIKVNHLRHEGILCDGCDPRDARRDIQPLPSWRTGRRGDSGKSWPGFKCSADWQNSDKTRVVEADDRALSDSGRTQSRFRYTQPGFTQGRGGLGPRQTDNNLVGTATYLYF